TPMTSGSFYMLDRSLVVRYYGKLKPAFILFVLAHELRHAQHVETGKYSDYYNPSHLHMLFYLDGHVKTPPRNYKLPSKRVAHRAELDCDLYAYKRLREYG